MGETIGYYSKIHKDFEFLKGKTIKDMLCDEIQFTDGSMIVCTIEDGYDGKEVEWEYFEE